MTPAFASEDRARASAWDGIEERLRAPVLDDFVEGRILEASEDDVLAHGLFLCPAHRDVNPSLHVSVMSSGKVLIHCQAQCTNEAVREALGRSWADFFPKHLQRRSAFRSSKGRAEYDGSEGTVAAREAALVGDAELLAELETRNFSEEIRRVYRVGAVVLNGEVWFSVPMRRPFEDTYCGTTLVMPWSRRPMRGTALRYRNEPGSEAGFYGLRDDLASSTVMLAEGVRTAVALEHALGVPALGYPGATFITGTSSWWHGTPANRRRFFHDQLGLSSGTEFAVWADCDPVGRRCAEKAARDLLRDGTQVGCAPVVRLVDIDPIREDGFDAADLLEGDPEEGPARLRSLLSQSEPLKPVRRGRKLTKRHAMQRLMTDLLTAADGGVLPVHELDAAVKDKFPEAGDRSIQRARAEICASVKSREQNGKFLARLVEGGEA